MPATLVLAVAAALATIVQEVVLEQCAELVHIQMQRMPATLVLAVPAALAIIALVVVLEQCAELVHTQLR